MGLRLLVEPQQGATYAQVLRLARYAEQLGFEGVFTSDHYLRIGPGDPSPGPLDAWLVLSGLAREVPRIRLGTMMSPVTLRQPVVLAVQAAQVDAMSGGRLELGVGAGWSEAEHRALGVPFPDARTRFDRLAEALEILTGIWRTSSGEAFQFRGEQYTIDGWPALPVPVQRPHPPILLGGLGVRRTPALAARFANEFNAPFTTPDGVRAAIQRVREACREVGREPSDLLFSAAVVLCCGRTPAEVAGRAADAGEPLGEIERMGAAGSPEIVAETLVRYRDVGATRMYGQITNLDDLGHLDLLAEAAELAGTR